MKDVIELAKQAGASRYTNRHYPDRPTHTFTVEQLELYTKLVVNAKLEEAAKTCDGLNNSETNSAHRYDQGTTERRAWNQATTDCADALRNLKEPTS